MAIKIRRAKSSDIGACYELTHTPEFIFPGDRRYVKRYIGDFIEKGIFFVAEENGKIAGFISAQITIAKNLWIDMLVVDKRERGHGIGSHLLKKTLSLARRKKMRMIFLDAPLFNKETVHFYKKLGLHQEKKFVWFTKELK